MHDNLPDDIEDLVDAGNRSGNILCLPEFFELGEEIDELLARPVVHVGDGELLNLGELILGDISLLGQLLPPLNELHINGLVEIGNYLGD